MIEYLSAGSGFPVLFILMGTLRGAQRFLYREEPWPTTPHRPGTPLLGQLLWNRWRANPALYRRSTGIWPRWIGRCR